MITTITKRDGRTVPFNYVKIANAIFKAAQAAGGDDYNESLQLANEVCEYIEDKLKTKSPTVEQVQDSVEKVLIEGGHSQTAKKYILYRAERTRIRDMNTSLMRIYEDLTFKSAAEVDIKRENANIDGDTAMGTMLRYGSEGSKQFYDLYVLDPAHAQAHRNGDIHIHDLDFYTLTTTCCQIDIVKLFKDGFCTGHGFLREPKDIQSYSALACIAIQSNQNDQHGGQSIPNFDYGMAPGIKKTYRRWYRANLGKALELLANREDGFALADAILIKLEEEKQLSPILANNNGYMQAEKQELEANDVSVSLIPRIQAFTLKQAYAETDKSAFQAMEALVHNLNTMHSRAGAQIPFSSINYGTDTSPEARMVIRNLLLATEAGLGNGETPIFPIQIFKVKEGINYNECDPNYDLFKLSLRVSALRLFPNYSFMDAPFNLQYYKEGDYNHEVAYMGCRTRVVANAHDKTREITCGRGNLSFSSVNLPRLGIEAKGDINKFYEMLDARLSLVFEQLLHRFRIQSQKRVRNYPFLMGQGIWLDSEYLGPDDTVGEILKHGTLTVGFIGLAETLKALIGEHHGESEKARKLGLEIIGRMRARTDAKSEETKLNFSLIATPAEGLSGRFVSIDAEKYGIIPGVTDREYYTNSFHVPVYFPINAFEKIRIEAPYHNLTNGGHISYVELDGDPIRNLDAFEQVVRCMKEAGIGYGSINHPVDRDPVCGYSGVINDVCPRCGRRAGEPVSKERLDELRRKYPNVPTHVCCD